MTTSEASENFKSEVYPENGGLAGLFDSEEISDKVEEIRNSPLQRLIDINGVEINQNGDITFDGLDINSDRYFVIKRGEQLVLFYINNEDYFSFCVWNNDGDIDDQGPAGYEKIYKYDITNDISTLKGPIKSHSFGGPIKV